ncbi:hypothetical protein [Paraburkholderia sp.]|uniref:hypothetical protein n=1 Tax=Paraburkholderia sp. TaxID=1926495 RepID=UPI002394DF40|nr:hypothetical protein [Paraburkholderia sp.]MDE1179487.1 hypothetical protein [Paraburkholderia sp.]
MTAEQFAYWLQGFTELTQGQTPSPAQWKCIREHLETVFKKVTPPVGEKPIDWKKLEEAMRKGLPDQKAVPEWPTYAPFWLDEGTRTGIAPGIISC